MTAPGTICVFAKPPLPGATKTRLASRLGDAGAAALARAFFDDTWARVGAVRGARRVLASTREVPEAFGLPGEEIWLQGEGDLGERLTRIVGRALTTAPWVLVVGSDCPILPLTSLEAARDALAAPRGAVLGPALDGGYYLLGLNHLSPGLLSDLPWSAPDTLAATQRRLIEHGLGVTLVEPSFDVDEPEDLERLAAALAGRPELAPHTAAALAALRQGM